MLLFDWNKIVKVSKGNVGDIIQILRIKLTRLNQKIITIKHLSFTSISSEVKVLS